MHLLCSYLVRLLSLNLLKGHQGEVYTTKFSKCGDFLASAGFDRNILLWDVFHPEAKNVACLKGHKNTILDVCWDIEATCLFSCAADKTVTMWDTVESQMIKRFKGHTKSVNSIDGSKRSGGLLVSGSDDCKIKIWDTRSKSC